MVLLAIITTICLVFQGYLRILSSFFGRLFGKIIGPFKYTLNIFRSLFKLKPKLPSFKAPRVFQTTKATESKDDVKLFDTDGDTVIVDNSASCIIWRNRKDFIDYTPINPEDIPVGIETVNRNGMPTGIGTLPISWRDDNGKLHYFEIKDVFDMPDSFRKYLRSTSLF